MRSVAAALLLFLSAWPAPAKEPCDAAYERLEAEQLLGRKEVRAAIDRLRRAVEGSPSFTKRVRGEVWLEASSSSKG